MSSVHLASWTLACGGVDVRQQMGCLRLAGFAAMDHITRPLDIAFVAVTGIDIIGRLDPLSRLGQLAVRPETHLALAALTLFSRPFVAALIVTVPSAAQRVDEGQVPQLCGGCVVLEGI